MSRVTLRAQVAALGERVAVLEAQAEEGRRRLAGAEGLVQSGRILLSKHVADLRRRIAGIGQRTIGSMVLK